MSAALRIRFVDSHTGGEPTRVVLAGVPDLGAGPIGQKLAVMRERFDDLRRAIVAEPRGSAPLVGALLLAPSAPSADVGTIFFNAAGYLGMCGHGTIGLVATLSYLGQLPGPRLTIETPAGEVRATVDPAGAGVVSVENVASYRLSRGLRVDLPGSGPVVGDVAWGGNWFYIVRDPPPYPIELAHASELLSWTIQLRAALARSGIRGRDGATIDHVALFGPPRNPRATSRNFVLCPNGSYDRSPCGTGTSAKVACLLADGELRAGETWVQESVVGSLFEASGVTRDGVTYPTIRGSAFVTAEGTLMLDPKDPFRAGFPG